jgi:hypothetical protein
MLAMPMTVVGRFSSMSFNNYSIPLVSCFGAGNFNEKVVKMGAILLLLGFGQHGKGFFGGKR